jgi:hypothetical protein
VESTGNNSVNTEDKVTGAEESNMDIVESKGNTAGDEQAGAEENVESEGNTSVNTEDQITDAEESNPVVLDSSSSDSDDSSFPPTRKSSEFKATQNPGANRSSNTVRGQLPCFIREGEGKVILKLGNEKTTPLPLYVVRGISAFKVLRPLAGKTVEIPEIPNTLTTRGVNTLLDLRWGRFRMPEHPSWLVPALTTADLLGDDDFINHVADILHIHPKKLTLANDVYKVVRDRYRLSRIVRLAPSKNEKCGYCRDFFGGTHARIEITICCGTKIHFACIKKASCCPYCGEGWLSIACCVCKVKTNGTPYHACLTVCCKADIHQECTYRLCNRECPSCGERFDRNGYPKKVENVEEFVRQRQQIRRNERDRAGISLQ